MKLFHAASKKVLWLSLELNYQVNIRDRTFILLDYVSIIMTMTFVKNSMSSLILVITETEKCVTSLLKQVCLLIMTN